MKLDVPWSNYICLDDGTNLYLFHFLVIIIRVWTKTSGCSYKMDFHTLFINVEGMGYFLADLLNIEHPAE